MTDAHWSAPGHTDLRKHLTVLQAAARLYATEPDEARGMARRLAGALSRAPATSLSAAVQSVLDAPDADMASALDGLIAALEQAIAEELTPQGAVLLVEDDASLVKLFSRMLARKGWEVVVAGTAEQAEAIARTHDLAAIVLDLVLPDADGRGLLLRLKQDPQSAAIPVVVVSAHDDPHVQAECFALGATEFLRKPVEPAALLEVIARRAIGAPSVESATEEDAEKRQVTDLTGLAMAFDRGVGKQRALAVTSVASAPTQDSASADISITDAMERIGAVLVGTVGERGTVARIGAEEMVVLADCDAGELAQRLEQVRSAAAPALEGAYHLAAGVTSIASGMDMSEAMDRAGRFLYLALRSPDEPILADPASAPHPTVRILLAEDDELTAKLLVYRLTREPGFEVTHSRDGLDALAVAEGERIDLAILDINMPGIDGFDLLSRLREIPRYADLPVAMLTALGSERDVVRGLELGANDYIVKPFSPTEVIARVRRLLGRAQRAR